jgi:hypothetical protein
MLLDTDIDHRTESDHVAGFPRTTMIIPPDINDRGLLDAIRSFRRAPVEQTRARSNRHQKCWRNVMNGQ